MPLPSSLTFSQASLQDYADCPRRFQLRYLLDVRWPAAHDGSISEWEARAQLGSAFHRLIYQHTVGIPIEALARTIEAEDLRRWWHAYLDTPPAGISGAVRQSEVRLTAPLSGPESAEPGFAGHRLMARYDLLAIEPGRQAVIVDWKTNQRRPMRADLEKRWQTRVYRYVLVRAGAQFNHGASWRPDQVELVYWFANHPAQPERFPYDDAQYTEDEWTLKATIGEIASRTEQVWTLTEDLKQCRYCTYRTLCEREKVDIEEPDWERDDEETLDLDIDLEQVAEIEF